MEHVQEQPHVQLSTSHTLINIPTYGVLDMLWLYMIPDAIRLTYIYYSEYTTCRDIYVGVTCGQLDMRSFLNMLHPYPCPHTFFISESSHCQK